VVDSKNRIARADHPRYAKLSVLDPFRQFGIVVLDGNSGHSPAITNSPKAMLSEPNTILVPIVVDDALLFDFASIGVMRNNRDIERNRALDVSHDGSLECEVSVI
jgi:hypothetical protein